MKEIDTLLLDFSKVLKAVSFYPEKHPSLMSALEKIKDELNLHSQERDLIIEINKEGFSIYGQKILATHPLLRELSQALTIRRVNKIIFHKGLNALELYTFLKLINMEVGVLFSAGGLETLIEQSDIRNIALSEVHLTKLLSKKEKERKSGSVNTTLEENKTKIESKLEVSEKDEKVLPGYLDELSISTDKEKGIEKRYRQVIEQLNEALITKKMGDFVKALKEAGEILTLLDWNNDYGKVIDLLAVIAGIEEDDLTIAGFKKEAESFIYNTLNEEKIYILVELLIRHIENEEIAKKINLILRSGKEPVVELMLNRLSTANEIKTRRILIEEITKLGDVAYNRVLYHLKDERWFVVRNMVTILGSFARRDSLPYLFEVALHPDIRVRKEVIKSLARIRDRKVIAFLKNRLNEEAEEDVKLLIIFTFGILRSNEAIDEIIKMLEKEKSLAIKKECLIALGKIGDKRTFEILKKYALRKSFFKKGENRILRLAAINGLAEFNIGEAVKVLEKLRDDSDVDVRDAAFEGLQKIRARSAIGV